MQICKHRFFPPSPALPPLAVRVIEFSPVGLVNTQFNRKISRVRTWQQGLLSGLGHFSPIACVCVHSCVFCVHVFVYMFLCVHVYMYVCMGMSVGVGTHVDVLACMCVHMCTSVYVFVYLGLCVCVFVCTCVGIHVHVFVCVHV